MMRRFFIGLMMVLLAIPVAMASGVPDDDDKDPVIKPGIRRLHPGRERAKAIKKLQEQMSRKAEPKADPWDTSDEVWGTVDLPPVATRDSNAVEGRRLTPGTGLQQAGDESLTGRGGRRMTWCDLPVTATIDQLMPGFTVAEDGDTSHVTSPATSPATRCILSSTCRKTACRDRCACASSIVVTIR
jgi:hypothetical protein